MKKSLRPARKCLRRWKWVFPLLRLVVTLIGLVFNYHIKRLIYA